MKNKTLLVLACLAMVASFFSSCTSTYFQVYTMKSDDLKMQDDFLLYENSDCKVSYNFWSEGGWVSFAFENKTNEDIFINMNESFLIVNGYAHNYFEDKTYTLGKVSTTTGYGERLDVSISGTTGIWSDVSYTASVGATASIISKATSVNYVTKKEEQVVCVPANAYKTFMKFYLSPRVLQTCEPKSDYPKSRLCIKQYDKKTSPIIINNRITYGSCGNKMDKHIDNVFWLEKIENLPSKEAIEKITIKECYNKNSKRGHYFKIGNPSQFYNTYKIRLI